MITTQEGPKKTSDIKKRGGLKAKKKEVGSSMVG